MSKGHSYRDSSLNNHNSSPQGHHGQPQSQGSPETEVSQHALLCDPSLPRFTSRRHELLAALNKLLQGQIDKEKKNQDMAGRRSMTMSSMMDRQKWQDIVPSTGLWERFPRKVYSEAHANYFAPRRYKGKHIPVKEDSKSSDDDEGNADAGRQVIQDTAGRRTATQALATQQRQAGSSTTTCSSLEEVPPCWPPGVPIPLVPECITSANSSNRADEHRSYDAYNIRKTLPPPPGKAANISREGSFPFHVALPVLRLHHYYSTNSSRHGSDEASTTSFRKRIEIVLANVFLWTLPGASFEAPWPPQWCKAVSRIESWRRDEYPNFGDNDPTKKSEPSCDSNAKDPYASLGALPFHLLHGYRFDFIPRPKPRRRSSDGSSAGGVPRYTSKENGEDSDTDDESKSPRVSETEMKPHQKATPSSITTTSIKTGCQKAAKKGTNDAKLDRLRRDIDKGYWANTHDEATFSSGWVVEDHWVTISTPGVKWCQEFIQCNPSEHVPIVEKAFWHHLPRSFGAGPLAAMSIAVEMKALLAKYKVGIPLDTVAHQLVPHLLRDFPCMLGDEHYAEQEDKRYRHNVKSDFVATLIAWMGGDKTVFAGALTDAILVHMEKLVPLQCAGHAHFGDDVFGNIQKCISLAHACDNSLPLGSVFSSLAFRLREHLTSFFQRIADT